MAPTGALACASERIRARSNVERRPEREAAEPQRPRSSRLEHGQPRPGPESEPDAEGHRVEPHVLAPARRWRELRHVRRSGREEDHLSEGPDDHRGHDAPVAAEERQRPEADRAQRRAHRERAGRAPVRGRRVQPHLEEDDEQRVEGEEQAVIACRQPELVHHPHRHRSLVLEEHQQDREQADDDVAESPVADGPERRRTAGVALHRMPPERECQQHQRGGDGGRSVHPEQQLERMGGEEASERRSDAHPEVDGQSVQRVGLPAQLARGEVAHQSERRRAHRLGHQREDHHAHHDLGHRLQEGQRPEAKPTEHERDGEDPLCAHPVREPPGEGGGQERDDAVDGQRHPGLRGGEAEVAGEVECQERDDHRPGAVHQGGQGEQPAVTGETRQARPGIERTPRHGGTGGWRG